MLLSLPISAQLAALEASADRVPKLAEDERDLAARLADVRALLSEARRDEATLKRAHAALAGVLSLADTSDEAPTEILGAHLLSDGMRHALNDALERFRTITLPREFTRKTLREQLDVSEAVLELVFREATDRGMLRMTRPYQNPTAPALYERYVPQRRAPAPTTGTVQVAEVDVTVPNPADVTIDVSADEAPAESEPAPPAEFTLNSSSTAPAAVEAAPLPVAVEDAAPSPAAVAPVTNDYPPATRRYIERALAAFRGGEFPGQFTRKDVRARFVVTDVVMQAIFTEAVTQGLVRIVRPFKYPATPALYECTPPAAPVIEDAPAESATPPAALTAREPFAVSIPRVLSAAPTDALSAYGWWTKTAEWHPVVLPVLTKALDEAFACGTIGRTPTAQGPLYHALSYAPAAPVAPTAQPELKDDPSLPIEERILRLLHRRPDGETPSYVAGVFRLSTAGARKLLDGLAEQGRAYLVHGATVARFKASA